MICRNDALIIAICSIWWPLCAFRRLMSNTSSGAHSSGLNNSGCQDDSDEDDDNMEICVDDERPEDDPRQNLLAAPANLDLTDHTSRDSDHSSSALPPRVDKPQQPQSPSSPNTDRPSTPGARPIASPSRDSDMSTKGNDYPFHLLTEFKLKFNANLELLVTYNIGFH